jgi:general secretion pathway protein L
MASTLLTAGIDLKRFWQWWMQELIAHVPQKLLSLLGAETKPALWLHLHGDELAFDAKTPEGDKRLACFTLDSEGKKRREDFFAGHPQFADSEKILCLHKGQALARFIALPLAAEDNLRQVLGYEMSRYTPFAEQELYYDVRGTAKNKESKQITAELIAVPKDVLNGIHRTIRDWGMDVHAAVYEASAATDYNLLPSELRAKIDRGPKLSRNILAGALLLLLASALALPLALKSRYVDILQEQTAAAAKKLKDIEKIKSGAQSLLDDVRKLTAQKRNEPSMLKVLNELTRLLPKDTWLNSFQYANHKVQIQGFSASASALIGIIEASPYFTQASFISPVIPDRQSGQDRFQIAMNVVVAGDESDKSNDE